MKKIVGIYDDMHIQQVPENLQATDLQQVEDMVFFSLVSDHCLQPTIKYEQISTSYFLVCFFICYRLHEVH